MDMHDENIRTVDQVSDEQMEIECNGLKFAAFEKWVKEAPSDPEYKALGKEIEKRAGLKEGSPINLMAIAFFAGMDAGIDLMDKMMADDKKQNPASTPAPTGSAN